MFACARKRTSVVESIQQAAQGNTKIIVFTARKADCAFYLKGIKASCPDLTIWMAHGETSTSDRDEIRRQYMAHPGPCVLIGTGQAWGTGLNLQDTDQLFMAMLPYEPAQLEQWIHRVYRLGMVRKPIVKFFIAENTYDEEIEDLMLSKIATVQNIIGVGTQTDVAKEMRKRDEAKITADLLASTVNYDQGDSEP
jgi:SNF2 family DNA or RNA helicase